MNHHNNAQALLHHKQCALKYTGTVNPEIAFDLFSSGRT